jgi:hypothetical protein
MKRIILPLVVLLLILGGAAYYLTHKGVARAKEVASWLPEGTLIVEDMPDIHRSRQRWPETALAQIINEQEVQAFLEKPLSELPGKDEINRRLGQVNTVDPEQFFAAVTEWGDKGGPKTILGLQYGGKKEDVEALVDEIRKAAQGQWPAAKSDIEKYGSGEIETFTTPDFSAGLAYRDNWLFIGTNVTVLKAMLDRYENGASPGSLADSDVFKKSLAPLTGDPDNVMYVRMELLADKWASAMLMLNPTADTSASEQLKKIVAMSAALKMDGALMRDSMYIIKPTPGMDTPLAKDALKLSSTDTIIAMSAVATKLDEVKLPDPHGDPSGVVQLLESYFKAFTDQGLGVAQYSQAFGPEMGFVLDWPAGSIIPAPLFMSDVKDADVARKFMDTLPKLPLAAGVSFTRSDDGGISFYSLPQTGVGMFPLQATLAQTSKGIIGGLSQPAVKEAEKRWETGGEGLAASDTYKNAAALVQEPTMSFLYFDAKVICDKVYGMIRGVATMGMIPGLANYADVGKMPAPETITKHLSPIVASTAVKDGGILEESAGPVTYMQGAMITGGLIGAAAVPIIIQQMKGQPVSIPGFPGFGGGAGPFGNPSSQGTSPNVTVPAIPAPSVSGT